MTTPRIQVAASWLDEGLGDQPWFDSTSLVDNGQAIEVKVYGCVDRLRNLTTFMDFPVRVVPADQGE